MPTAMQTAASTVLTPDHAAPARDGNGNSHGNGPANHGGSDAPLNGHAGAHNRLPDQPTPAGPLDPHPTPHTPHSTRLSPDQLALTLAAFLDGNMTLAEVCEYAEISLSELHAWAQSGGVAPNAVNFVGAGRSGAPPRRSKRRAERAGSGLVAPVGSLFEGSEP